VQVLARAGAFDQRLQRALARRAIHHGQLHAQRDLLGGQFEAAQVWRQEHNPAAAVELALDQFPVFHCDVAGDARLFGAPDERQFDDALAGFGDGGAQVLP
jgi:hypothetical protein